MSPSSDQVPFSAPPRMIAARQTACVLLGSARSQIGWLILGLGSFLAWQFAGHADLSGWRFRYGRVGETAGQFLYCVQTHYAEGGGRYRAGISIFENHYRYAVLDRPFEAVSYLKGECPGGVLPVQYLVDHPEVSRVRGMRRQPFSAWAALTLVMPAAGLVLIAMALAQGRRHLRLLRDGLLATGHAVEKLRTNVQTAGRFVYRVSFAYVRQDGASRQIATRTSRPERFESAAGTPLLYHPADINCATLLASIPSHKSLVFLALPILTVIGNSWYIYHRFFTGS